jgi:predicted GIY-YIG superfamily endonuclease
LPREYVLARDVVVPAVVIGMLMIEGAATAIESLSAGVAAAGPALTADGLLATGAGSTGAAGGGVVVYRALDSTGRVIYVGITNDVARRSAKHLRVSGIRIRAIPGLENLSRINARGVEQALINLHGLMKNGGTLMNKINSISPQNPVYEEAVQHGTELLKGAGG